MDRGCALCKYYQQKIISAVQGKIVDETSIRPKVLLTKCLSTKCPSDQRSVGWQYPAAVHSRRPGGGGGGVGVDCRKI